MRRRALLSTVAFTTTAATAGCLGDVRQRLSGPIRFDHARGRIHDASQSFVRGGLGGSPTEDQYAAWLFTSAPSSDVAVFTDALGLETRREWDNEVHNENYDAGFVLLAQVRTGREHARRLGPVPYICDPAWTGWRRARVPLSLDPANLETDELAGADGVVATLAAYVTAPEAPRAATVPFLSTGADACEAANATLTAESWSPP
ncbi:hypothetical protein [Salinigranum salinum]|uniref:hypothetical protein n=1 Tax=Salinigranum salinum TaxID=1364937 RepID=UPI001260F0CB|nr:hypothetical protein [Salinigranum salinum]